MEHNVKGVREEKVQSIMKQLKSKEEEAISMETK